MTLSIIKGKRKQRSFLTYDFEWIPGTLEIRLCGLYDGEKYHCFKTIESFLNYVLTSKYRGKWFYAHAGGLADFQFILENLVGRSGYEIKAAFSGSSAIIVKVKRGKNCWHFIDSYWLLRDKLENIAKWIGMAKGESEKRQTEEEAKEFYRSADIYTLMQYNELDCEILWKAIDQFQDILWELGGQLQKTIASCALQLFRRKFLTSDINTCNAVNERARQAYFASRVEVFEEKCTDAFYYDINSSFPYAMTSPCPGELLGSTNHLPDYGLYMADVTIRVPECYLPPIPMRIKGRLFFPVGVWRSWLSNVDIELLLEEGGQILRVHEAMQFAPFHDLSAYATTIYEMRKNASTPVEKIVLKFLLNSLYGKFAESATKSALHINPCKIDRENWEMLFPGAWLYEKEVPVPHMHVPVSTHITAQARKTIFNYMSKCREFHYCDTDGFSTPDHLLTSDDLGDIKLEKMIDDSHWVAPKVYNMQGRELQKDGSWKELGDKGVKAKGFSRMNVERFQHLLEGKAIAYERMARIKESAKRGIIQPREMTIMKRLQNVVLDKRFHYPDGKTRPWTFSELENYFQGNRKW